MMLNSNRNIVSGENDFILLEDNTTSFLYFPQTASFSTDPSFCLLQSIPYRDPHVSISPSLYLSASLVFLFSTCDSFFHLCFSLSLLSVCLKYILCLFVLDSMAIWFLSEGWWSYSSLPCLDKIVTWHTDVEFSVSLLSHAHTHSKKTFILIWWSD